MGSQEEEEEDAGYDIPPCSCIWTPHLARYTGFARRYFTLHQSGLLSYSLHRGEPPRDQICLTQAAIATAPGRKDIHIDSSTATFHIKCLSGEDFDKWMLAFR
jgi:oxysterol-binding protein-related protein 3/6/7